MGALHYLALDGSELALARHLPSTGGDGDGTLAWSAACDVMQRRFETIAQLVARTPQTNEVARSMPLLAGWLAIADRTQMPLRVFEIGSSAGLNLRLEAYRYIGAEWSWGPTDSRVVLRNREEFGIPQHLNAKITVLARRGCDVHPLDATDPRALLELLSFVWADQTERFDRLRAALEIARDFPVSIDTADGTAWLQERVEPAREVATIVMHSVIVEHLSPRTRAALSTQVARCGERASENSPLAWLRMEPHGDRYETRLTLWPDAHEYLIAASDGHAQGLRWFRLADERIGLEERV